MNFVFLDEYRWPKILAFLQTEDIAILFEYGYATLRPTARYR